MKNPVTQLGKALAVPNAGRSSQWHAVRMRHLQAHPFCAFCGGTDSLEVHHVRPFHIDRDRELDSSNLITLCEKIGAQCHLRVGHFGNWKSHNPLVRQVATALKNLPAQCCAKTQKLPQSP